MKHFFSQSVDQALNDKSYNINLAKEFLFGRQNKYVIGKNDQSLRLSKITKINGVIDDFSKEKSNWNGLQVFYSDEIEKTSIIANCSTSISPVNTALMLKRKGFEKIVSIYDLVCFSENIFQDNFFLMIQKSDYINHRSEWESLFDSLADEISKKTLLDIIRYRITCDYKYMEDYSVRTDQQYFESFINLDAEYVFVDAGAFEGETTQIFCQKHPNYKKIYLYEPSKANMEKAKKNLGAYNNIEYKNIGLSDKSEYLRFISDAGSASNIAKDGDEIICTKSLDEDITEKISFLKIDIEGWELNALAGAKNHIINDTPVIAIAAYHNMNDLRLIKNFVSGINNNYRIYLRHYTQGWSESILYFIPN